MEQKKMASTARTLDKVIKVVRKIIFVCMIVVVAVVGVLTIAIAINPNTVIGEGFENIDVGPLTFEVSARHVPDNRTVLIYTWIYTVFGIASAAVIWKSLGVVRDILRPMTDGRPFHRDAARSIKKLGWMSLVLGILGNIGSAVETTVALRHFGIDEIIGGAVKSVTANYTFDLTFVLVFLVLMLMSYIFSYGAQLQELSDETL